MLHVYNLYKLFSLTPIHVNVLLIWEETKVPRVNPFV